MTQARQEEILVTLGGIVRNFATPKERIALDGEASAYTTKIIFDLVGIVHRGNFGRTIVTLQMHPQEAAATVAGIVAAASRLSAGCAQQVAYQAFLDHKHRCISQSPAATLLDCDWSAGRVQVEVPAAIGYADSAFAELSQLDRDNDAGQIDDEEYDTRRVALIHGRGWAGRHEPVVGSKEK